MNINNLRLSISNILWDPNKDIEVAKILNNFNIDTIDIAPTKYFDISRNTSIEDVLNIKNKWAKYGINIYGIQSLFFNKRDLNMFGTSQERAKMLDHLQLTLDLVSFLGAKSLVFGSPINRNRGERSDNEVLMIMTEFFNEIANMIQRYDIDLCIEPNPKEYNCNFITTTKEAVEVVKIINNKSIKIQLDTGSIFINKENIYQICKDYKNLIGHIHISEPRLKTLGTSGVSHTEASKAINKFMPNSTITIESISENRINCIQDLTTSIIYAKKVYLGYE
tara:strand:- start:129 stop:965 length:837 start_codon:yes stop_codon:yes gene_type:complete